MDSHRTTARSVTLLAAMLALGLAGPASAEEAAEEVEVVDRISGIVQFDFTNAYFFRGILNDRDAFIFQPWAELYVNLYSSEAGFFRDVTVGMGVWNSIQSDETLADHSPTGLYETDWYPLVSIGLPWGLTTTATYYFYTSPNGAFSTVQEFNQKLEWDDSELLGSWALAPWVNLAVETQRTSLGPDKGVGIQMGIEPTLVDCDCEPLGFQLTAPLELGLSATDYYEDAAGNDDVFGYFSWGLAATVPLGFIPEGFGTWSFTVSGKGYVFGDNLADVNHGDDVYGVAMASLGFEF